MLLGVTAALAGSSFAQAAAEYVPGQVLVKFKPSFSSQASQIVGRMGGTIVKTIHGLDIHLVKLPAGKSVPSAVSQLKGTVQVQYAHPNLYRQYDATPNDPDYPKQWGLPMIGMPSVWDRTTGKVGAVVAIVDSGVDMDHPDLVGNLLPGYDFGEGDADPDDVVGHGTHVAGIAGAVGNNGIGGTGAGWTTKILPVKIATASGGLSLDAIIEGVKYSADRGAKVINMSFGGYGEAPGERDAMLYAHNKGSLLMASAGNDGVTNPHFPSSFPFVVCVSATNEADQGASWSNYGPDADIAAPGENIWATLIGGYGYNTGTSMASPMAAGAAALLFAYGRSNLTNIEVRNALESTAKPMPGFVEKGRIQMAEAIKRIPRPVAMTLSLAAIARQSGGTPIGNVVNARTADGSFYSIPSVQHTTLGAISGAIATFRVPTTQSVDKIEGFDLSQRIKGALRVTNILYIYNWNTKTYELLQSKPMSSALSSSSVNVKLKSGYVSSTREIRFLTRGILPRRLQTTSNASYTLAIDELKLALSTTE